MEEKKWYKKFKVMTGLATIVMELVILIVVGIAGKEISPQILSLMRYVFAIGIAVITGHTITDSISALGKAKK